MYLKGISSIYLTVLLAVIMAVVLAEQQKPDCVSIARSLLDDRERQDEISKHYYHHEKDCNKYYQCAEYGLVLKECPEDLHFDRDLYVCGWPHEVNC